MLDETTRLLKLSAAVLCFGTAAFDELTAPKPAAAVHEHHVQRVRVISVIDGDTYEVEPVSTRFRVRLANADTWESRRVRRAGSSGIGDEELAKGKLAKVAVAELLDSGQVYVETEPAKDLHPVRTDSFGRVLGLVRVSREGKVVDVGEWLSENGHTRTE